MSDEARVKIVTRAWCGFCTAALRLLKQNSIPHEHVDMTGDRAGMEALKMQTGHFTMPQVFLDGELIGGYTELERYLRTHGADALKPR